LKQVIAVANIVVALVVAGALAIQGSLDRGRVIAGAEADAVNLASALAEHTRQTLLALDLAIGSLPDAAIAGRGLDKAVLHRVLRERQALSPGTFGFYVIDSDGRLAATSLRENPEPVFLSGHPEYGAHRDDPEAGLVISPPPQGHHRGCPGPLDPDPEPAPRSPRRRLCRGGGGGAVPRLPAGFLPCPAPWR